MQTHKVTFIDDLRANGWRYAAPVFGIALYLVLKRLGVELWLATLFPVLLAAALGVIIGRQRR